jgi:NTP pyrophosphatase (non-canonical NTP hydrolase)
MGNKGFNELEENVIFWAKDRGLLDNPTPLHKATQALKCVSEVGEFANHAARGFCIKDDIGDIVVTLIINAALHNTSVEKCLELAWNEIKDRKGKMINGVFVKEADLPKESTLLDIKAMLNFK